MNRFFFAVLLVSSLSCGLTPVEEATLTVEPVVTPEKMTAVAPPVAELSPWIRLPLVPGEIRTVLKDETTLIQLVLDPTTVFCTAFGYGSTFLKVSIPQLDQLAFFDHRVEGTDVPCAAVGECSEEVGPQTILQSGNGTEPVSVRVVLTEVLRIDAERQTCTRQLIEDVYATVRGVPLRHQEEDRPSPMNFEACVLLSQPPSP